MIAITCTTTLAEQALNSKYALIACRILLQFKEI